MHGKVRDEMGFAFEQPSASATQRVAPSRPVNRASREYIRWVQRSLNKVSGLRLADDGVAGSQTRSAIRDFQRRSGLVVDGTLGPATEQALIGAGALAPPATTGSVVSPAPARPTKLPPQEQTAAGTTIYAAIDLKIAAASSEVAKPVTGIFLPHGYRPQARADVIVYLHGHKVRPNLTINAYWDASQFAHFALREATAASRRNVILVAPTLGPRSQSGALLWRGGLGAFMAKVFAAINQERAHRAAGMRTEPGNIILACHSGGGYPMRQLALGGDNAASAIRECWGFDCTYNTGDDTLWAQWARKHPDRRLFIYYIPGSKTAPRALSLAKKKAPNAIVLSSRPRGGHNAVPLAHWRERLEGAAFLKTVGA